jgi:hypothetical protein
MVKARTEPGREARLDEVARFIGSQVDGQTVCRSAMWPLGLRRGSPRQR